MPLKTLALDEPGINLTSMLDIVLLLIIFFMIGTQFKDNEKQYDIQLPTVADATALTGQPDELVINVTADGGYIFKSVPRSLTDLEAELKAARERFPGQGVVVRGDGNGRYQPVMDVMSACRRAGIRNVSLAHRTGGTP